MERRWHGDGFAMNVHQNLCLGAGLDLFRLRFGLVGLGLLLGLLRCGFGVGSMRRLFFFLCASFALGTFEKPSLFLCLSTCPIKVQVQHLEIVVMGFTKFMNFSHIIIKCVQTVFSVQQVGTIGLL